MHTHARSQGWASFLLTAHLLTRQRAHDHTRSTMYPEKTTRTRPCSGIGASLGARALCALLGRAPLLTSLRASLGRFKRSRASTSGSVRQEARSNLHARRAVLHDLDAALSGRLRHGRCACPPPPLASRAHRGLWPLRRPLRTHLPRAPSFRRPPSSRRGEAAAALRGNLMAPERLLRGARAPNGQHRSHCNEFARRARRLASPCLAADRVAARPAQAKSGFATAHLTGEHVRIRDGLVAPE